VSRPASAASGTVLASTPAAVVAPANTAPTYRVRSGDSLWSIARRHGVTVAALQATNGVSSSALRPGQSLRIPAPGAGSVVAATYRVRPGDSLWAIARRHETNVSTLRQANGLRSNELRPGQVLALPTR
jgi:LysM repeat protein